jgi:hypothetical protein
MSTGTLEWRRGVKRSAMLGTALVILGLVSLITSFAGIFADRTPSALIGLAFLVGGLWLLTRVGRRLASPQVGDAESPFASKIDYAQNLQQLPDNRLLRAILLDKAVADATTSLLIWGAINLGAWYLLREDTNSTFSKINAPPGTFDKFIYGGAVLGACMLIFGVLGAVSRSSIVGWLNGISLLVVGGWNYMYDFLLGDAVRHYGYTVEDPSLGNFGVIWLMLGICQVIWGGKQLIRFWILGAKPRDIDRAVKKEAQVKLIEALKAPASPQTGRLRLSVMTQRFYFPLRKWEQFTMWLLPDRAYCLENSLGRFFEVERDSLKGRQFTELTIKLPRKRGISRNVSLDASSLAALNEWLRVE